MSIHKDPEFSSHISLKDSTGPGSKAKKLPGNLYWLDTADPQFIPSIKVEYIGDVSVLDFMLRSSNSVLHTELFLAGKEENEYFADDDEALEDIIEEVESGYEVFDDVDAGIPTFLKAENAICFLIEKHLLTTLVDGTPVGKHILGDDFNHANVRDTAWQLLEVLSMDLGDLTDEFLEECKIEKDYFTYFSDRVGDLLFGRGFYSENYSVIEEMMHALFVTPLNIPEALWEIYQEDLDDLEDEDEEGLDDGIYDLNAPPEYDLPAFKHIEAVVEGDGERAMYMLRLVKELGERYDIFEAGEDEEE